MGSDGYVLGDENLGFIIRRNFVTSNISSGNCGESQSSRGVNPD
jgi:hypothetical protein